MASRVRKGDNVIVLSGSDKGKTGLVAAVSGDRAVVEGVNIRVKHIKKTKDEAGRIETFPASVHISNLSHMALDGTPTKVSFVNVDGKKFLFSKKDNKEIRKV